MYLHDKYTKAAYALYIYICVCVRVCECECGNIPFVYRIVRKMLKQMERKSYALCWKNALSKKHTVHIIVHHIHSHEYVLRCSVMRCGVVWCGAVNVVWTEHPCVLWMRTCFIRLACSAFALHRLAFICRCWTNAHSTTRTCYVLCVLAYKLLYINT